MQGGINEEEIKDMIKTLEEAVNHPKLEKKDRCYIYLAIARLRCFLENPTEYPDSETLNAIFLATYIKENGLLKSMD